MHNFIVYIVKGKKFNCLKQTGTASNDAK